MHTYSHIAYDRRYTIVYCQLSADRIWLLLLLLLKHTYTKWKSHPKWTSNIFKNINSTFDNGQKLFCMPYHDLLFPIFSLVVVDLCEIDSKVFFSRYYCCHWNFHLCRDVAYPIAIINWQEWKSIQVCINFWVNKRQNDWN